jgi:hypothetical protein
VSSRADAGYDDLDYEYVEGLVEEDDDYEPDPDDDLGPFCAECGCSQLKPCEGGCVWATPALCSRCART